MADIPRKTEENVSPFIRHTKLYRSIPKAVMSTTDGTNFYITFDSGDSEKEKGKCNSSLEKQASSEQSLVTERKLKHKTVPVETKAKIDQHPELVQDNSVASRVDLKTQNNDISGVDVYNNTKLTKVEDIAVINDKVIPETARMHQLDPNEPILSENKISDIFIRIWNGLKTVRRKLLKTPIHTSSCLGPEGRHICKHEEHCG